MSIKQQYERPVLKRLYNELSKVRVNQDTDELQRQGIIKKKDPLRPKVRKNQHDKSEGMPGRNVMKHNGYTHFLAQKKKMTEMKQNECMTKYDNLQEKRKMGTEVQRGRNSSRVKKIPKSMGFYQKKHK